MIRIRARSRADSNSAIRIDVVRVAGVRVEGVRVEGVRVAVVRFAGARVDEVRVEAARFAGVRVGEVRVERVRVEGVRVEGVRVDGVRFAVVRVAVARFGVARVVVRVDVVLVDGALVGARFSVARARELVVDRAAGLARAVLVDLAVVFVRAAVVVRAVVAVRGFVDSFAFRAAVAAAPIFGRVLVREAAVFVRAEARRVVPVAAMRGVAVRLPVVRFPVVGFAVELADVRLAVAVAVFERLAVEGAFAAVLFRAAVLSEAEGLFARVARLVDVACFFDPVDRARADFPEADFVPEVRLVAICAPPRCASGAGV